MHRGAEDKTHVGLLQQQRRHDLRRVQRFHRDRIARVLLAEGLERARQHLVAQRQHAQDAQLAGVAARAQVGREALHLVELRKQPLDVRIQRERLGGRCEPALGALEQRKAQLQFGMLQGAAHRRLRDVDEPRRRAHAAREHDRVENFDVAQAHGRLSCLRSCCGRGPSPCGSQDRASARWSRPARTRHRPNARRSPAGRSAPPPAPWS